MMRRLTQSKPNEIEADYLQRVKPGLAYCQRVGNIMGATLYLSWQVRLIRVHSMLQSESAVFPTGQAAALNFIAGLLCRKARNIYGDLKLSVI